jgi:ribonuclease PH
MTSEGKYVEVQGTAEAKPFSKETMDSLLTLAEKGIKQLLEAQQAVIREIKAS